MNNNNNLTRKKSFENCYRKFSTGSEFGRMLAWQKCQDMHLIVPDDAK